MNPAETSPTGVSGRLGSVRYWWRTPESLAVVAVAVLLVLAFVVSVAIWADHWLHNDVWGYVQRGWTFRGLLTPAAGHPAPLNIAVALATKDFFGYDPNIEYAIVRSVAWMILLGSLAWSTVQRGGSAIAALFGVGLLAVWPLAAWQEGWYLSNPLAYSTALVLGVVIAKSSRPSYAKLTLVTLLTVFLSVSTTTGTVLAFALTASVVITGHRRRWWPTAVAVPLAYGAWRLVYGVPDQQASLGSLSDVPKTWFEIAREGIANTFSTNELFSALILVLALIAVAISFRRRRPDLLDITMMIATGAFVMSILVFRIEPGLANTLATRYQYAVVLFLLAVILPRVPTPTRATTRWTSLVAVVLLLTLIVPRHVNDTLAIDKFRVNRTGNERELLATEAFLLDSGEPAVRNSPVGVQPLWSAGFRSLLDDGLRDVLNNPNPAREAEARGWLQMEIRRMGPALDDSSCLPGTEQVLHSPSESLTVSGTEGTVALTTGTGPARVSLPRQGTYKVTPLFDAPTEVVTLSDSLCVVSSDR